MVKTLKTLLLMLTLLVGCAPASASAATVITATNVGEGNHTFKAGEAEVKCTTVNAAGTAPTAGEESLTLHPTYSGCTFLGEKATVDTAGCNFVLGAATSSGHGKTEIECTGGNAIRVKTAACSLAFGSQLATGGASYANLGSGTTRDVTAKLTITPTFSKSGPLCFLIPGTTGTYSGVLTLRGYRDKGGPTNEDEFVEGAQKGIWWEGEEFRTDEDISTVLTATNEDEGEHVFKAGEAEVKCATVAAAGTAAALNAGSLTLHPTYSGCEFLGEPSVTVDTTGCNLVLQGATSSGHGKTEIECTAGNSIKVTISGVCNLAFAPQTGGGGTSYANAGSGASRDITAKFTDTLTFTKESGPLCFLIPGPTATYTGALTLRGYEDEGGPTNEDEFVEGAQKGIWWEGEEFRAEEET